MKNRSYEPARALLIAAFVGVLGCQSSSLQDAATAIQEGPSRPALSISATFGGLSRLTARWGMEQRRLRGVRKGSRVELENGSTAILAVTALDAPIRVDSDPNCRSCVLLRGTLPLKLETSNSAATGSTLIEQPERWKARWQLSARLQPAWVASGLELRAVPAVPESVSADLSWPGQPIQPAELHSAARDLALEVVRAEVMQTISQLTLLHLGRWPGAQEQFPISNILTLIRPPLLHLVLSSPVSDEIDPRDIRPGVGQDLTIGISPSLLLKQLRATKRRADDESSQLLVLTSEKRALRYRVRHSYGNDLFEADGLTVPGRRGQAVRFDLLGPPELRQRSGKLLPTEELRVRAAGEALKPISQFLAMLRIHGPGSIPAALDIARYENGSLRLESTFTDPRARPTGPPPAHRSVHPSPARRPTPPPAAEDPDAPKPAPLKPPWAHPDPLP